MHITIPKGAALPVNADTAFSPKRLVIKKGSTVTWTNEDSILHTVTSGIDTPDNIFNSGYLKKGEAFSHTFNETGSFPYYCTPHPWAKGEIVVEE